MFSRRLQSVLNIADLKRMARRRLPKIIFDFVESGTEDDLGLRTNAAAFERVRLVPRYYVDTSRRTQEKTLFGRAYASPFGVAPMGMAGFARRDADACLAMAAAAADIPYVLSSAANLSIEEVAKLAPKNAWYQIYSARERSITLDHVRRAADAGIAALLVTVDVPIPSNREKNRRNGFVRPARVPFRKLLDTGLLHPLWTISYVRNGGIPMLVNWLAYAGAGATADGVAGFMSTQTPDASQTWADFEAIRKAWSGPLLVKGLLHPKDAILAREAGADGIVVSNHGGRQLDAAPSPLEMLAHIRRAVGSGLTLIADSGVQRGWHIAATLCAGADFVLVGRSLLYGAVAAGVPGAAMAIAILQRELDLVMAQVGAAGVADFGPQNLLRDGAFIADQRGPASG